MNDELCITNTVIFMFISCFETIYLLYILDQCRIRDRDTADTQIRDYFCLLVKYSGKTILWISLFGPW